MSIAASPSPGAHGQLFAGRYSIRRKLGSGSFGAVYLAQDRVQGRRVALKILRVERLSRASRGRLQEEFRAVASLRHPQVARAYDFGYSEPGGVPFYTREYIAGQPLAPGPPGGQRPEAFLKPLLDLLDALEYVHGRGVLHLDLHPGNLIVAGEDERGSVVIDFGPRPPLKTPHFPASALSCPVLPPELLERREPSAATDIFFAGRLLLYRVTGRSQGAPTLPREIPGWGTRLTTELERIIQKAVQPAPERRFASAAQLRGALLKALGARDERPAAEIDSLTVLGREAEVGAVEELLGRAAAGKCGSEWFIGGRGLGKTRLLAEARLRAQLRGLDTADVRFDRGPAPEPSLLRTLRRGRSKRGGERWLALLSPSCGGTPRERARKAAQAYFLGEGGPMAILLDDVDLADEESLLLALALAAECNRRHREGLEGRGLALIVAGAQDPRGAEAGVATRRLRPLEAPPAADLFRSLLRPLTAAEGIVRQAVARAGGSPSRLRQLAAALRKEWAGTESIPASVRLPALPPAAPAAAGDLPPGDRRLLESLAMVGRAITRTELAGALREPVAAVGRALQRLAAAELVIRRGPLYEYAGTPELASRHAAATPRARRLHLRLAAHLQARGRSGARDQEHLARHLLAAGRQKAGRQAALAAAAHLRSRGSFDRAVRILDLAAEREEDLDARCALVEEMSVILEETGDHEKAITLLERVAGGSPPAGMRPRALLRLKRRLGVSYHRAGMPHKALEVFGHAQRLADPRDDLDELIFMDSELAEIYIFQGEYAEAEAACLRGLERLGRSPPGEPRRGRFEVMLRASLGHIALRKLSLDRARTELESALRLSREHGTPSDRAAILHNLGVAANQQSDFAAARRFFEATLRVLERAGEQRNITKVCTNLALIAVKLGDAEESGAHLARAASLLRQYPDQRLECFFAYSQGLTALWLGELDLAMDSLRRAGMLASELGDVSLAGFARLYLAEACLFAGRYRDSLRLLGGRARPGEEVESEALRRGRLSRRYLLETLLGRREARMRTAAALASAPAGDIELVKAWNDLFAGAARMLAGEPGSEVLQKSRETFERLRVAGGAWLARLALLVLRGAGGAPGERELALKGLDDLGRETGGRQRFASVAAPLAAAAVAFALGRLDTAEEQLAVATSAIVGCPFLELDLQLELLRARLAVKRGQVEEARRHVHRCLHARDLLLQLLPQRLRRSFGQEPRFAPLQEIARRFQAPRTPRLSTASLQSGAPYEGMVGRSSAMLQLFDEIERAARLDLPVLIAGETGSGKDLAARALHRRSPRRDRPYVALHCACLPPQLFESELFGHEAGAFTGAEEARPGLLEEADGGTLFLDELGQLPLESQGKLLRVLESASFRRLGSAEGRRADVRFIATAAADLRRAAETGAMRPELYFRVAALELRVPPLRERRDDIPLLARHFLQEHAAALGRRAPRLEDGALELLTSHAWPGNVRELSTLLLRLLVQLPDVEAIGGRELAPVLKPIAIPAHGTDLLARPLDEWRLDLEREYLRRLFESVEGDTKEMMRRLGIKSSKLYDWLREVGLDIRRLREGL